MNTITIRQLHRRQDFRYESDAKPDRSIFQPNRIVYALSKQPWDHIDPGLVGRR